MNPTDAKKHLDLVERILESNDRDFCIAGDIFLVWGLCGALIDLLFQVWQMGRIPVQGLWFGFAALLLSGIYSGMRGRQLARTRERMPIRQREFLNVLWLAIGAVFVAQLGAMRIFEGWASSSLWTISAAIVTLYAGLHGNRAGLIGGIVLLVSLVVANFTPGIEGFVLAGGMIVGYAGFGITAMLARD